MKTSKPKKTLSNAERDARNAKKLGLKVCACGWYAGIGHECWPKASRAADKIQEAYCFIPSTRLGYGDHKLTFKFAKENVLRLAFDKHGTVRVDGLHWLNRLTGDQLTALVMGLFTAVSAGKP